MVSSARQSEKKKKKKGIYALGKTHMRIWWVGALDVHNAKIGIEGGH